MVDRKSILGQLKYELIEEDTAILHIKIELDRLKYEELKAKKMDNSLIFIVIDRSGSMYDLIHGIKDCSKRFVDSYI